MMKSFYNLPEDLEKDIEVYRSEIESFLRGEIHPTQFKGKRVPRGVYEQRTNNTYMMRIRIPAGGITPVQLEKVSELSKKYGNGILHITTRQDIQLHWIKLEDTPDIMLELLEVGFTSKGGGGNTLRNITACYDAGVCDKEIFDVAPYNIALTEYLIKDPRSFNLPRKFKIAFSGCSSDCSFATVNDLGFVAAQRSINGKKENGFRVYVAGGLGHKSRVAKILEDFIPLSEVGNVSEAIMRLFDKYGNRKNKHKARLRFLFEKFGGDEFMKRYRDYLSNVKKEGSVKLEIREIKTPSGIPEPPPNLTADVSKSSAEDGTYNRWLSQNVFPQKQEDFFYMKIFLELGHISAEQMKKMAGVVRNSKEGTIRSTHDQNLVFRWVHRSELKALYGELKKIGLNRPGAKTVENITCCAGASTCRPGICLSRGLSNAISDIFKKESKIIQSIDNLKIKISGCPNACGQDPIGQIGLYGVARRVGGRMVPHYMITLGGRVEEGKTALGEKIAMAPSKDMPYIILEFLKDYKLNGKKGDFYEYIENRGRKVLKGLLEKYESVTSFEDKKYFIDWEAEEEFTLAGRGPGECGAGVLDMMEVDLKEAKHSISRAEEILNKGGNPVDELYQAINNSSRALLIARGLEASSDTEAFEYFDELFINTGLVDKKFRKIMQIAAESNNNGNLNEEALIKNFASIKEFTEAVADLYDSMDDSLQFRAEKSKQEAEKATKTEAKTEVRLLDLKGVKCPFNYVKAKLQLEIMETGALLELFIDDGEPIINVPTSLKNDGQEILEMEKTDTGHYRLLVKKKV